MSTAYTVVVPTVGRPCLDRLVRDLAGQGSGGTPPQEVVVVDDRPGDGQRLSLPGLPWPVRVLRTGGRGPAAARNAGWRSAHTPWVAFLDDDVRLPADWSARLTHDLDTVGPDVGGVQGRIVVPRPDHRRPTDWERNTAGLESALWATADMAYRTAALAAVSGFDERFPLAYREDADLALRVRQAGWRLVRGARQVVHPARPVGGAVSIRVQAGAASDALMRALHGPRWRALAGTGRGRLRWHLATVGSGTAAAALAVAGRAGTAAVPAAGWLLLTADFARVRIVPGPRPGEQGWLREWARMAWTSVVIPWVAVGHRLRGTLAYRGGVPAWPPPVRAVLFDRDGTLVEDVPYNGDPDRVRAVPGGPRAVARLRSAGLRLGMVTNQSGVARGLIDEGDVGAVNDRVQQLVGPLATIQSCPHAPEEGCPCRKPGGLMVLRAAAELGVAPHECVVIGDIGADVDAARVAGARSVLVPTPVTLATEVRAAEHVSADLEEATQLVLAMAGVSGR